MVNRKARGDRYLRPVSADCLATASEVAIQTDWRDHTCSERYGQQQ